MVYMPYTHNRHALYKKGATIFLLKMITPKLNADACPLFHEQAMTCTLRKPLLRLVTSFIRAAGDR